MKSKTSDNKASKNIISFFVLFLISVLLGACNRDIEEFRFVGKVVDAKMCNSSMYGYVIDIMSPDSIGGEITTGGGTYHHAVMAYRASRALMKDEVVYGVAYFTKSYSALNCLGLINSDLPEVILLSVDEDSSEYKLSPLLNN